MIAKKNLELQILEESQDLVRRKYEKMDKENVAPKPKTKKICSP